MDKHQLKGQRLAALFLAGVLIFNYPLFLLFSRNGTIWGIPILYFSIFVCWAVFIGLMALIIEFFH